MLRTKLKLLDEKTGEVSDHEFVERGHQRKQMKEVIMCQQGELALLASNRIRGNDLRALLLLMSKCNWNNRVYITRTALASELGVTVENLYKSLQELKRRMHIHFTPTDRGSFEIDPMLCWRGKHEERGPAKSRFLTYFH